MISQLASPSVCVIDDEPQDFGPILASLNELFVSSIHLSGAIEGLPPQPFDKVRLVFLDLHLSGTIGKDAASYTANFFRRAFSTDTAPVVVVIWSKYASDKVVADGTPEEDQETEAELFERTLLDAEPKYKGRLIFVRMSKPKSDDRPQDWTAVLKAEIANALNNQPAIDLLWAWDRLVKDGCAKVSQDLTLVAQSAIPGPARDLKDGLKATMQHLATAQGAGDMSAATAPKHLLTALTQLLVDQLEHPSGIASVADHGAWLSHTPLGVVSVDFPAQMNGFLLTSDIRPDAGLYVPGTVYLIKDASKFSSFFGKEVDDLLASWTSKASPRWGDWKRDAKPVLIELSPICDLAQGHRVNSLLVGGVIAPASYTVKKSGDAFGELTAKFHLRWPLGDFAAGDAVLGYCHRFKTTIPAGAAVDWLEAWFRLRDLPLAAVRNANAAHGARVGYVSLS
jgi:hypothetical protein